MKEKLFLETVRIAPLFGCRVRGRDRNLLRLCCQQALADFLGENNLKVMPDEALRGIAMRGLGEFMAVKKSAGDLSAFEGDMKPFVKSISEGDTSYVFKEGGESEPLDAVIGYLKKSGGAGRFKRLKW